MKISSIGWLAFMVTLRAIPCGAQTSLPAADSSRMEALRNCARLVAMNKSDSEEFLREVRGLCETFPEVKPHYVTGEMAFTPVLLNAAGTGFDAIRFRTKAGYNWKLVWCFVYPPPSRPDDPEWANLRNWYIVRRKDGMRGFGEPGRSFLRAEYTDAPWRGKRYLTIQELHSDPLMPDEEYLIWFRFSDERSAEMFAQICLVPWESWHGTELREAIFGLHEPPPSAPEDPSGVLLQGAAQNDLEAVMAAVDHGADIRLAKDDGGRTALALAATGFNEELVKFLLDCGADVNARDNEGATPLHYAAMVRRTELGVVLLERGADVNAKDNSGLTPLQQILDDDFGLDFIKMLVAEGADLSLTNRNGQTSLEEARAAGCPQIAAFLEAQQENGPGHTAAELQREESADEDNP